MIQSKKDLVRTLKAEADSAWTKHLGSQDDVTESYWRGVWVGLQWALFKTGSMKDE